MTTYPTRDDQLQFIRELLLEVGYGNSVASYDRNPNNPKFAQHLWKLYWDLQARGVFDWIYSCKGKNVYGTAWQATKASYYQTEWRKTPYEPYKCRFCGKYHVGRQIDKREEKRKFYDERIRRAVSQR